jgi:hypothetical protein
VVHQEARLNVELLHALDLVLARHGGVLDALYRLATGQDVDAPRTWELPNAAINRLLWTPDSLTVVGWSDTQHLADGAAEDAQHHQPAEERLAEEDVGEEGADRGQEAGALT